MERGHFVRLSAKRERSRHAGDSVERALHARGQDVRAPNSRLISSLLVSSGWIVRLRASDLENFYQHQSGDEAADVRRIGDAALL